jgi:hypothetical protein
VKLVAFSGKCGSGKTTAAFHAISVFGGTRISLGDGVKEEVGEFIASMGVGYERRHLYGSQADREESLVVSVAEWSRADYRPRAVLNGYMTWLNDTTIAITYRQLLQLWGTEYRRVQCESYWCDKGREKIRAAEGLVFIDDIRFPDEARMVHEEGGMLIRLVRPGGPRIKESGHASETSLDDYKEFNWTVWNGGTEDEFKAEIERILGLVL